MEDLTLKDIICEMLKRSNEGKLHFALAVMHPDGEGQWWFEAHTSGKLKLLRALFEMDTNAEAEARIYLEGKKNAPEEKVVYFNLPPQQVKAE